MKRLLETSSVKPEQKDYDRINSIMTKAGSDIAKAEKLAINMAKAIKDNAKMQRRYAAAESILGKDHPVTKAFGSSEATKPTPSTGKSALQFVKDNDEPNYNKIVKAFKNKGLNFDSVDASKIQQLSSNDAFKYGGAEGDKYFKIWMKDDEIAFCTWANTMIDDKFNWNQKGKGSEKRIYANIIGNQPHIDGYFKSNNYLKNITNVYMIPFTAFGKAAVEMVEDERSKFLNTKSVIDNEELILNQLTAKKQADKYIRNQRTSLEKVINSIDSSIEVKIDMQNKSMDVRGFDRYSAGYLGPGIQHDWWFDLDLLDNLSYGKYDWNGHTHSINASYDYAKAELKKAGVKMAFASDCKSRIREFIKKVKSLPQYKEFIEDLRTYTDLDNAYDTDLLIKNFKDGAVKLLSSIGHFNANTGYFVIQGVNFHVFQNNFNTLDFVASTYGESKSLIANRVKEIATEYKNIFEPFKREGTIVLGLRLRPEIAKKIKK